MFTLNTHTYSMAPFLLIFSEFFLLRFLTYSFEVVTIFICDIDGYCKCENISLIVKGAGEESERENGRKLKKNTNICQLPFVS